MQRGGPVRVLIIGGSLPPSLRDGYDPGGGFNKQVWLIAREIANLPGVRVDLIPYHLTREFVFREKKLQVIKVSSILPFANPYANILVPCFLFNDVSRFVPKKKAIYVLSRNIVIYSVVRRNLKNKLYDIVHLHGTTPEFCLFHNLLYKYPAPKLLTLHGIYSTDENIRLYFNKNFEIYSLKKHFEKQYYFSTVSEETSRELERILKLEEGRVFTVENGIDNIFFEKPRLSPKERSYLREKLQIPRNTIVALSVGSLSHRKNHLLFLKALARIKAEVDIHYLLVGDGPLLYVLKDFCKKHGLKERVHFLGSRNLEELVKIYDISDFLVHLPTSEGFGLVYAEALSRGIPILTVGNLPFPRKYLNTRNAVLCNSLSVEEACFGVKEMVKQIKANKFKKDTIIKEAKVFSSRRMAEEYLRLYSTIILSYQRNHYKIKS